MIEREQKLAFSPGLEVPSLDGVDDGVVAERLPDQTLEATYYDTDDLRLARSGITVRFRTGEAARGKWTVKLPAGEAGPALSRREIDVAAPRRIVPPAVSSIVRGHVRSARLAPVGTLRTERRRIALRNAEGVPLAEVVDDDVSVIEGARTTARFRELEVELTNDATTELLPRVVGRLVAAGAAEADQIPKIVRALGPRALDPPDVVVPEVDPKRGTLRDVVAAALGDGFTHMLRHDPGVRLGGDDEDVHQARVAARRLRSDLRTFRSVLDADASSALRDELQWIGAELGVVRDTDVLLERLRRHAALLPAADAAPAAALLLRLEQEREAARAALRAVLDGDRYLRLLDALAAAVADPPVTDAAGVPARKALPDIVRGPWKHLRQAVGTLVDHPEDEALHDVRIRAKRTRYAAEAAAVVAGRPALRFAKAVAGLQSVLGDLQDAVVAEEWLRKAAAEGPAGAAFAAGQLVAVERQAMAASREAWPEAWAEASSKKLRAWLS